MLLSVHELLVPLGAREDDVDPDPGVGITHLIKTILKVDKNMT